jgi:hypothetical protein
VDQIAASGRETDAWMHRLEAEIAALEEPGRR